MKRLFWKFEKETGMVTDIMKKGEPKWSNKNGHISVLAQVTNAFNEWLNHLWNKNQISTRKSTLGHPNKFMVTKWVKQMKLV